MKHSLQESVVARASLLGLIEIIALIAAHFSGISIEHEWLLGINLAAVLVIFAIALEFTMLPREFRSLRLRKGMASAVGAAKSNPGLQLVLHEVLDHLATDLTSLRRGYFKDARGSVPKLSVEVARAVRRSAMAVFIADDRSSEYTFGEGLNYIEAWYSRAKQLGPNRLHRLFVVNSFSEIDPACVSLIEDHIKSEVSVSVIERHVAESLVKDRQLNLDFGLFDDECLMLVTTNEQGKEVLSVYVRLEDANNDKKLSEYSHLWTALTQDKRTIGGIMFLRDYYRPPNAQFWSNKLFSQSPTLGPPHGLSTVDANHMVQDAVKGHVPNNSLKVAILGFTTRLIEECLRDDKISHITLLDQSDVDARHNLPQSPRLTRERPSNWLTYSTKTKFDVILGDEALNNVRPEQYRRFFQSMRRLLKPNGLLILRTMARYEGSTYLQNLEAAQLSDDIRKSAQHQNVIEDGVCILRYLHSEEVAFNPKTRIIETRRYNNLLKSWIANGTINERLAERYWFPDKHHQDLILSSVEPEEIYNACRSCFEPRTSEAVDPAYCGKKQDLDHLYKVLVFAAKEGCVEHTLDLAE